jgi:hypothetical protein
MDAKTRDEEASKKPVKTPTPSPIEGIKQIRQKILDALNPKK